MDAIDVFYPIRMAERILGMGMLCPWLKEHKSSLMRKKRERFKKKLLKNEFGLMISCHKFSK
jgi:signal recognition particle subunit SRP54